MDTIRQRHGDDPIWRVRPSGRSLFQPLGSLLGGNPSDGSRPWDVPLCPPEARGRMIRCENVWKSYTLGHRKKMVLQGISCEIKRGEKIALLGRNGAGKSTLVRSVTSPV